MNKNHDVSKQLLERVLKELPDKAGHARFYVQKAINEIVKTAPKKPSPQQTPLQQWQLDLSTGSLMPSNPIVAQNAINNIESLIAKEQAKIENIKQPKAPKINSMQPLPLTLLNG